MKIEVENLYKPMVCQVTGDEPWLALLYSSFPAPSDQAPPKLTASLRVSPGPQDSVDVTGELSYQPFVPCSRCQQPIPWPIQESFAITYRPALSAPPAQTEQVFQAEAAEVADLCDGVIDLEALLNDQVQLAIPLRTVNDDDQDHQKTCLVPAAGGRVYTTDPEGGSPFAALKNWGEGKA